MRARIANGELGKLRRLYVEYTQGWLADRIELQGGNNAGWRTDPKQSGKAGCIGDIGTHAWHLCEYITGQHVTELCAVLNTFAPGRQVDDDGVAMLRFDGGLKGTLTATQIAKGEENNIRFRVYGEKGGMEWRQMDPNRLIFKGNNKPEEIIHIGNNAKIGETALWNTRTPAGHPEGFIEAFANIYCNFACTVSAKMDGKEPTADMLDFPTVHDGVRGMQFIETAVRSGWDDSQKWVPWIE